MLSHNNATPPIVIKLGGHSTDPDATLRAAASLAATGARLVLVHGGGPAIDHRLAERGLPCPRIDGLRATDEAALEIVEATLCGTLNKQLVRAARAAGLDAVGVSGQDGGLLTAERHADRRLGCVGIALRCRPDLLHHLLRNAYLPVVAPLALDRAGHTALNVNADHAAAAIAAALGADRLLFVTDVAFVRRDAADPATAIPHLGADEARALAPRCDGGMRPKLEAAASAIAGGVRQCLIGDLAIFAGTGTIIAA